MKVEELMMSASREKIGQPCAEAKRAPYEAIVKDAQGLSTSKTTSLEPRLDLGVHEESRSAPGNQSPTYTWFWERLAIELVFSI